MRPFDLSPEKLCHIERLLKDGPMRLRRLWLHHRVFEWEVEQAAELGWVRIFLRESPHGRAARMAKLSERADARLPRPRRQIEKEISLKHEAFARRAVFESMPRGSRFCGFSIPPTYVAYLLCYPKAGGMAVTSAAASRLMRRLDVQAALAWRYAKFAQEIPQAGLMPRTVSGIRARLIELGCNDRARTF